MNRTVLAFCVRSFACKEQRVLDRLGQGLVRPLLANLSVAVGSSRKRIALPVMEVRVLEQSMKFLRTQAQQTMQGFNALFNDERLASAREPRGTVKRRPPDQQRKLDRRRSPPGGEPAAMGKHKTHHVA